jgi:HEPN domain-containing protein
MNRYDLRDLARVRLKEAQTLLRNGCFDGAYYLAGYAIECALKACIAKRTKRNDFPDKKLVDKSFSHDLDQLLNTAGLKADLELSFATQPRLEENWAMVKKWSEASRYTFTDVLAAENMISAIMERQHGVLQWIRQYW